MKQLLPHLIISLIFCLLTPVFFGVENLDAIRTAQLLEMYIGLVGIIMLTPIFLPEQYKDIKDVVYSKKTAMIEVHVIRVLEGIICQGILLFCVLLYLRNNNCDFPFLQYYLGIMANAIFLGGIGIFIYALFDNIAIAYMMPIMYYLLNYGSSKKMLGRFILFSMVRGSYNEKYYLAIVGILLIMIGILIRHFEKTITMNWFGRIKG